MEEHDDPLKHLRPGDTIDGRWIIDRMLGEGGMGVVYAAHNAETEMEVALKILTVTSPDAVNRFKMEAKAPARIRHDGFVKVLFLGTHEGRIYLVMELLSGADLLSTLRAAGPMPIERVLRILMQVCDAMGAAHALDIAHRDLKPENIFLQPGDVVKVLDLGIAKFRDKPRHQRTRTSAVLGTPNTMSPEQCRGSDVDHRSDIYSLGIVAYFMFSGGRYPFVKEYQGDYMVAHMYEQPPALVGLAPHVPPALAEVVHQAMAKDRGQRFQTMAEFSSALRYFIHSGVPDQMHGRLATTKELAPQHSPPLLTPPPTAPPPSGEIPREHSDRHSTREPGAPESAQSAIASQRSLARGEVSSPEVMPRPRRRWGWAVAATLVVATGAAGAGYYALTPRQRPNGEPVAPAAMPAAPKPAAETEVAQPPAPKPEQKPADTFRLLVDVDPPNAELFVDGKQRTGSAPFTLEGEPGRTFHLEARREGFSTKTQEATVESSDQRVALKLEPLSTRSAPKNGLLSVSVLPFAEVTVDGKSVGTTPIRSLALKPGSHAVEIVNKGLNKRDSRTVKIEPGRHTKIPIDWSN